MNILFVQNFVQKLVHNKKKLYICTIIINNKKMKNEFGTYKLKNIKSNKYWLSNKYKKLFKWLNKDSIFSECYEEKMFREGKDIIIQTTWKGEGELPKGIIELNN